MLALHVALVTPELDNLADVLEGQVERRLPKLLDELAGVRLVARDGYQLTAASPSPTKWRLRCGRHCRAIMWITDQSLA